MEITRQADYAVRAVLDLAMLSDGERAFAGAIADRQNIPTAFLTKIFSRLSAEGIVTTRRGVKGGVRLARPASKITMLEVIEAIDGPIALNRCTRHPSDCPLDATCAVYPVWHMLCDELRVRLNSITFDMLAASARSSRGEAASAVLRGLAEPA